MGNISRDIGLFQDTDGTGYLLSEDRNNGLHIYKLSADHLSVHSAVALLGSGGSANSFESPAMAKVRSNVACPQPSRTGHTHATTCGSSDHAPSADPPLTHR